MQQLLNEATTTIGRQRWLDAPGGALQRAVTNSFSSAGSLGKKAADLLHGTWLNHPLHPTISDAPIGAWTSTILLDTAAFASGVEELERGAEVTAGFGLAASVLVASAGLSDYQYAQSSSRRVGLVHGLLNLSAAGFFGASLACRLRGSVGAGRALGLIGWLAAFIASYLGGELVFHDQLGMNHALAQWPPQEFVPVLREEELVDGEPKQVETDGCSVLLVREGGRVYALAANCAHLGAPLAQGHLQDGSIVCPWHGSRFALEDGHIINGPSAFPQPHFQTDIHDGQIEVRSLTE